MNKAKKVFKVNGSPESAGGNGLHSNLVPNGDSHNSANVRQVVKKLYPLLRGREKKIIDWKVSQGLSLEEAFIEFIDERGGNPAHIEDYFTMMMLGVANLGDAINQYVEYTREFDRLHDLEEDAIEEVGL